MAKSYTYPHVSVSTTALSRSTTSTTTNDTTILFVPFISDMGPVNELVKIYSLEDFISTYGSIDYSTQGQTILNVANWLTNGGTILACRLFNANEATIVKAKGKASEDDTSLSIIATAKYAGTAYEDITVTIAPVNTTFTKVNISISDGDTTESFKRISVKSVNSTIAAGSNFLASLVISDGTDKTVTALKDSRVISFGLDYTEENNPVTPNGFSTMNAALAAAYLPPESTPAEYSVYKILASELATPVDLILDAGYSLAIKTSMATFATECRDDIIVLFDSFDGTSGTLVDVDIDNIQGTNFAVYSQKLMIEEATYVDEDNATDIWVTPTYFLSSLIPYNDILNGIQYPVAGISRYTLSGIKAIDYNPDPDTKQAWFDSRINYIEKDSRCYSFMSQRTRDGGDDDDFTALSFLNNSRTAKYIARECNLMGRDYLHEYNDSATISYMSSALNKYVNTWVSNRALESATVTVESDAYSTEEVDAVLTMKFTSITEVISIDLILE